jgi:Recombination endonuclease VII
MEIPKEIACTKCKEVKLLTKEFFSPQSAYKYGFTRWCRDCVSKNSTEYNTEKRKEYRTNWARNARGSNVHFYKAREFQREMKKYGTTVDWYRNKLIEQNGLCAMCEHLSHHHGTIQRLQVDHSHDCCDIKTKSCGKCLRGLLCANCNVLLSYLERFLKEAVTPPIPTEGTWLSKAVGYLEAHKGKRDLATYTIQA